MIKKVIHIVISFFLFFAFAGLTVNTHYCNNKVFSVKINNHAKKCCDNNECGHCNDKTIILKIHDDFLPETQFKIHPVYSSISLFLISIPVQSVNSISNPIALIYPVQDISPPVSSVKIPLLQSFLL